MGVYRFNLEAKISQVVGIKAESKEAARAELDRILNELVDKPARSDTNLSDIKKGLRELGRITDVTINEEDSKQRFQGYTEDYYDDINEYWGKNNPNKEEDGQWDKEIVIKLKPEEPKYDVQLFFECNPDEEYKELPFFDSKIYVRSEGSGYAEIRNITNIQYETLIAALKLKYDITNVLFDRTKLKDGDASLNYKNKRRAFKIKEKKTPESAHVRPIYPNNPPPLKGSITLVEAPGLFELLGIRS